MIDYNLLPYFPNIENMQGMQVKDFRSGQAFTAENRLPAIEELKILLDEIDYSIVSATEAENHTRLDIKDLNDPDGRILISAISAPTHLSFDQCSFEQVLEIAKAICEKFGPYYVGYNGFNEIYVVDAGSDFTAPLAPAVEGEPDKYITYLKRTGIRTQTDPDDDPRIAEARKESSYLQATKLLCDILGPDLLAQNYKRLSDWFYCHDRDFVKMIAPNYVMLTSESTIYVSAVFRILNKRKLKQHGILVPEFPDINSFERTVIYPRKKEFKAWGYKNVTSSTVTDLKWMMDQQEHIRNFAKGFPALITELER